MVCKDKDFYGGIELQNTLRERDEWENEIKNEIYLIIKRIIDIIGAILGLIVFSPIVIVVGILIKLESSGSVIFSQERIGYKGKKFKMYKFRTMNENAEKLQVNLEMKNELKGPMFKIKDDPRVTKVGKILRSRSIDEIPQFINILKGDMSLVGPRPSLKREIDKLEEWMKIRLEVKPGLTCYWQVQGRNSIEFEEWMQLDKKYVNERSTYIDIKLIYKTIFVFLGDKNAY
ncbi:MAG: sugar transferase [Clostridium sp.]